MPNYDMRDFINKLDDRGELRRVKRQVDTRYEIANVSKKALETNGPALLFEKVKGSKFPVACGILGTKERVFSAYETSPKEWPKKYLNAMRSPVPCKSVRDGECKENILEGKKVDLMKFPILWHHRGDRGFYMTATNVIVKDPETGTRNVSCHRALRVTKTKFAVWENIFQLREVMDKYWQMKKPCPAAIVVGVSPELFCASTCRVPYEIDELEFAGAIRGEPVNMIQCETIDVDVPATSEFVVEGEFPINQHVTEAPFAEFPGTFGQVRQSPIFRVKAVTYRDNMIYQGLVSGTPPDEQHPILCVNKMGDLYRLVNEIVPEDRIKGINLPIGGVGQKAIISIRKIRPGEGKAVILVTLGYPSIKEIIVVDDDINPFDPVKVEWAVTIRSRHEDILGVETTGQPLMPNNRGICLMGKFGIDATLPIDDDKIARKDVFDVCAYPTDGINLDHYV